MVLNASSNSALNRKINMQRAKKLSVKEVYNFYCSVTKSPEPIAYTTFKEYHELYYKVDPAVQMLLADLYRTAKRY
jgi:hypothetical protein